MELLARKIIEEADVRQAFRFLRLADFGHPRAVANEQEDDVVAILESTGGLEELGCRMG